MNNFPSSHPYRRRSIRLADYDYGQVGAYYLTINTLHGACVLADIVDAGTRLTRWGEIVQEEWLRTPRIRPEIMLDEYVIMPNHVHAILLIVEDTRPMPAAGNITRPGKPSALHGPARSLGSLVGGFKIGTTKRINELRGTPGVQFWHRNYYEHVVRNDADLDRIRTYIRNNPARWTEDEYNPSR